MNYSFIICLLLFNFLITSCRGQNTTAESESIPLSKQSISLVFAGDLMQHQPQITSASIAGGFDYEECFRYVQETIESADVAVGNFETTLAGTPYSGFPRFSAPDDFLRGAKNAGFDILLNANNHVCDKGQAGIERTLIMMDSLGIGHLGAYADSLQRANTYPFLLVKNGFRIVLLNYTYGTNGLPVNKPNVVNYIDREQMFADINKAKKMHPDCIIAFMHWGEEYHIEPNDMQQKLAKWLFEQGVTHIIGSHPHVMQPVEVQIDSLSDQRHILAYSLGNFVSNQSKPFTYGGMLVHMTLEKDSVARLADCNYSLYFVTRPSMSGHKSHRVYDIRTPDSELSVSERKLRDTFIEQSKQVLRNNKNIKQAK